MVLSPGMQEVLDAALKDADESVQRRFGMLLEAQPGAISQLQTERSARLTQADERPSPDAAVEASQTHWREVRQYLIESGIGLAARTADLYDPALRVEHVPAISTTSWLPSGPVPLENLVLQWDDNPPKARITGIEAEARPALPLRAPGHAFTRYTAAIRYLRKPALFENRHSYRLTDIEWSEGAGRMTFGLSTFFDKLDVSEVLAHESAAAELGGHLDWSYLPFRGLVSDPFDLSTRIVNPGVSTLTIRRNTADGSGTFFLLRRDPTQVTNGRHYSLLPAGEFQPASISPQSISSDLDIWRNMVREYAEEMLGQPEHDGSSGVPVDYDVWPFYRDMTAARDAGTVRPHALGVILDALSLNSSIATTTVIDDTVFDDLFRDLVATNPEGEVVFSLNNNKSIRGLPFDEETVRRLTTREPLGQTSAACLTLAWRHRKQLLD
ncbi:XRE family transcriptional regulator [Kribbella pittospori]|uniref:XRE family transcriptional regulator n=1 Tax=Kribbella pittospori TaxID=722689 RepID=A0A4R0KZH8_9ACTN|nr:XRE family transcriptional regulator [Kribbella pittospori]TCC65687.1 XRE family transcriptional regulator [Kribbella pittospori]